MRSGVLKEAEARIEISIDTERNQIVVRDNGVGIPASTARAHLSNVGHSTKTLDNNIGFRGIGRLHGIAYCDNVIFRTSYAGEAIATEVRFNARDLRELMAPMMRRDDRAEDILYACTYVSTPDESKESHYFEATLSNVSAEVPQLLSFTEIQDYLSQVAPVDFDTPFGWGPKIKSWAKEQQLNINSVPIIIRSGGAKERYIYKPYKMRYKPLRDKSDGSKAPDIEIDDVAFYPTDGSTERGFWIWYSKSNLIGQIGDKSAAGLRLRKHNMCVGGTARLDELLKESRFNRYFIGEVHVTSVDCIPNARRDGFEDTEAWARIRQELTAFMHDREKEVRNESKSRSDPLARAIGVAVTVAQKAGEAAKNGIAFEVERQKLLAEVADSKSRLTSNASGQLKDAHQAEFERAVALLDTAVSSVASAPYLVTQTKGQLDRKQKKLLQDILETLGTCLPPEMFTIARNAIMARFEPKENK